MNSTVYVYKKRIQTFIDLMDQNDPQWIKLASWESFLLDFELGANFFQSACSLFSQLETVCVQVSTEWLDQFNKQGEDDLATVMAKSYLLGTEINVDIREEGDDFEVQIQQKMLDYAWWVTIKDRIYTSFSETIQDKLDIKQEQLEDHPDFF